MLKFFKHFAIYGLSSILSKVAAVFLMPLYTNTLTQKEYGVMALVIACKGIIDLISNLNIHTGISRDYYEEGVDRKSLISTGFWSILFFSFVIFAGIYSSRNFWINRVLEIEGYETVFLFMALSIPSGSLLSYFSILARFRNQPVKYAFGSVMQVLVQIGLSVYCVLILHTGVVGIFIAVFIAETFGILYFGILNLTELDFKFDKAALKRALQFSLPTLPAILAGWADNSLGQLMVGKFVSIEKLGVYSIAVQLVSVFTLISVALNNVWYPYAYEHYKKYDFQTQSIRLFEVVAYILLFITLNLGFLSKDIIVLLSNPSYLDAAQYLTLLCFSSALYLLLPFVSISVNITRETQYISYAYGLGSIINVTLLFLFLSRIGVMAIPIFLGVSRVVTFAILETYSKRKTNIKYPVGPLYALLGASLLCFCFVRINVETWSNYLTLFFLDILFVYFLVKKFKTLDFLSSKFRLNMK